MRSYKNRLILKVVGVILIAAGSLGALVVYIAHILNPTGLVISVAVLLGIVLAGVGAISNAASAILWG